MTSTLTTHLVQPESNRADILTDKAVLLESSAILSEVNITRFYPNSKGTKKTNILLSGKKDQHHSKKMVTVITITKPKNPSIFWHTITVQVTLHDSVVLSP